MNMSIGQEEPTVTERTITTTEKERTKDSYVHGVIVLIVILSATMLRVTHNLDVATISTVYGAALGYATGLTASKTRNGYSK